MSPSTNTVLKNALSGSKNHPGTVKIARKLLPGHQHVSVHQNSPQKHTAGRTNPQVRSNSPGSYLLDINVSMSTKIVLKKVLSQSKTLSRTVKITRKLSSGHERVTVHRNSTQKRAQWVEKLPRYPEIQLN